MQNLEDFYRKVADKSNVLYFFFSEIYLILGRPLMSEKTLKAMMETHRYALQRFSPNEKVKGRMKGTVKEEHYTVCSEPGGRYLCHFTLDKDLTKRKPVEVIANHLVDFLKKNSI